MASPTYYTPAAPVGTPAFMIKPESRILVGTGRQYLSLDNTSFTYATYQVSIGLRAGQSFEIGLVASLSFKYQPKIDPVDSVNTADASVYVVSGEETTLTVGVQEFKTQTLKLALTTGTSWTLGTEWVAAFGGGCAAVYRPISIEFTNDACDAPTSASIATGITGGVLTLYDCICTSGLQWDMTAAELNKMDLEFQAIPVTARTKGRRLGSLYIY